ncbi:hypothetical protein DR046_20775 [Jannaschia formosa]|nr:hypothetical protein DR046_20775 [Jannaschia formosa]
MVSTAAATAVLRWFQTRRLRQPQISTTFTTAPGALMLETNDEWAVARRYRSLETLARVTDNPTVRLPAVAT